METAPLYFVLYARAEYDSDTAGNTGRPPCMGSDFRAIRYLLRLNKKDSSAYLGEGETDFAGTMEVLKKANYKGWLHLENFYDRKPLCDTQASFIEVAKHDLALLKQACE